MARPTFDERAATWDDDPKKIERARAVADAILQKVELRDDLRVLEYGAGTGLLTQQFANRVGHVTLSDPSEGMREVMLEKVAAGAFGSADVMDLDLARDEAPALEVDLIVTMMVLHHVPDLPRAFRGFAKLLADGGILCAVDLESEDGSFHGDDFDGHHGLAREDVMGWMRDAGLDVTHYGRCHEIVKDSRTYGLFLAVGRKSANN